MESIYRWMRACPGLEDLAQEQIGPLPGAWGVFCEGRKQTVLGVDLMERQMVRTTYLYRLVHHSLEDTAPYQFSYLQEILGSTLPLSGFDITVTVSKERCARRDTDGLLRWEAEVAIGVTQLPWSLGPA